MSTPELVDVTQALNRSLGLDEGLGLEQAAEPTGAAPETPPAEVPAAAEEPQGITIAGRTYANDEEVRKALEHANQLISTRDQQAAAEPEPEGEYEEPDPWSHIPGIPQETKTQLRDWAVDKPLEAAVWAYEHREQLPVDIARNVIDYGISQDRLGWEAYREEALRAYTDQVATERTERFAVAEQNAIAKSAESALREELGDAYEQYEPRINELVDAGRYAPPPDGLSTEEAVKYVWRSCYQQLWLQDNWQSLQHLTPAQQAAAAGEAAAEAVPATVPQNPNAAATATRGAAAPAAGSAADEVKRAVNRSLGLPENTGIAV